MRAILAPLYSVSNFPGCAPPGTPSMAPSARRCRLSDWPSFPAFGRGDPPASTATVASSLGWSGTLRGHRHRGPRPVQDELEQRRLLRHVANHPALRQHIGRRGQDHAVAWPSARFVSPLHLTYSAETVQPTPNPVRRSAIRRGTS